MVEIIWDVLDYNLEDLESLSHHIFHLEITFIISSRIVNVKRNYTDEVLTL